MKFDEDMIWIPAAFVLAVFLFNIGGTKAFSNPVILGSLIFGPILIYFVFKDSFSSSEEVNDKKSSYDSKEKESDSEIINYEDKIRCQKCKTLNKVPLSLSAKQKLTCGKCGESLVII